MSRSPSAPSRVAVLLAVAMAVVFAARPAHAQVANAYAREAGGLYKSDLVRLLTSGGYTVEEILHIVRMNCVEFTPSERDRQDLSRFRGGAEVLEEVDRCRTGGPPGAGYRNGMPVPKQVGEIETPPRPGAIRVEEIDLDAPATLSGEAPVLGAPETTMLGPESGLPGVRADAPPRLLNWEDVTRRILAEYRPDVRRPGEVVLRIRVDAEGRPGEALLERTSGDPALAEAALRAVPHMRFAAAESRNRHVEAWAVLPIRFAAN